MREWWRGLLAERMDRRTYAIYSVIYIVAYALLTRVLPQFPAAILLPPLWMFFLAAPRLRDIGWNPWWAALPFAAGFASGVVRLMAPSVANALSVTIGLLSLLMMIGLGLKRGDQRDRLEVFS